MTRGARTPEELETLLEDAFVTRNGDSLTPLFEDGAVLAASNSQLVARGRDEIARLAATLWEHNRTYLADPRRIVQAHETALVVAENGINVVRRGSDGGWRYTIALVSFEHNAKEE